MNMQARGSNQSQNVGEDDLTGLRPGERQVLTEMKDLLKSLYRQNDLLFQRMEKLEDEVAMRSTTSGEAGVMEAERHIQGVHVPEATSSRREEDNLERTMNVECPPPPRHPRDLSPPPPPPPIPNRVATTPNGTRVPLDTPPATPVGTPKFGQGKGMLDQSLNDPRAVSFRADRQGESEVRISFSGSETPFFPEGSSCFQPPPPIPQFAQGSTGFPFAHGSTGFPSGQGSTRFPFIQGFTGLPQANPNDMSVPSDQGLSAGEPRSGRDPFVPGDRTWWKLPKLPEPGSEDSCIAVSDWITQVRPIMSDLSDRSSLWWERVEAV